jgi:hypothetical protein
MLALFCHFHHIGFPLVEHSVDIHGDVGASWLEQSPSIIEAGDVAHFIVSGCCMVSIIIRYFC